VSLLSNEIIVVSEFSEKIGLGHFRRSQSLIQHIQEFSCATSHYLITDNAKIDPTYLGKKCKTINLEGEDQLLIQLQNINFKLIIVDTYTFHIRLYQFLKESNKPTIYLGKPKNLAKGNIYVVNVAEGNRPFCLTNNKNLFEGIGFFIPDINLKIQKNGNHFRTELRKILVVFGGTDAEELSNVVLDYYMINTPKNIKVDIISRRLKNKSEIKKTRNIKILDFTKNLIKQLPKYDFVITSPGNLYFETLYLGIPLVSVCQNKKQERDFAYYPLVYKKHKLESILKDLPKFYKRAKSFNLIYPYEPGYRLNEILNLIKEITTIENNLIYENWKT
jgi:spore coat polysaccharide biosynthesis predicted glycosyltransferase SpsG